MNDYKSQINISIEWRVNLHVVIKIKKFYSNGFVYIFFIKEHSMSLNIYDLVVSSFVIRSPGCLNLNTFTCI